METRELYFSPERGWTHDPQGAVLMLRTKLEQQLVGRGENTFLTPTPEGWVPIVEERLHPTQRALRWQVWPQRIDGREYVAFRGLRVVDQALLRGPLAGLTLLDRRGRRLADPLAAGETFLLNAGDAQKFAQRVKQAGGALDRVESWLPEVERHLAGVEECQREISLNLRADMEAVERIGRGDLSEQLAFDSRGARTRELVGRARALLTRMDEDLSELERTSTATRARGAELRERAQSLSHEIEALGAARTRLEELAARALRRAEGGADVTTQHPDLAVEILMRDLADLWGSSGHQVERKGQTLIVSLGDLRLELGRKVRVLKPGEAAPGQQEGEPDWVAQTQWPGASD